MGYAQRRELRLRWVVREYTHGHALISRPVEKINQARSDIGRQKVQRRSIHPTLDTLGHELRAGAGVFTRQPYLLVGEITGLGLIAQPFLGSTVGCERTQRARAE